MTSIITNRDYLKRDQYAGASHLLARIQLHQRFSTNPVSFFTWMYDQIGLEPGLDVLEVGCGSGDFWQANKDRVPDAVHLTLTDLSSGMIQDARKSISSNLQVKFAAADVEHLPFPPNRFDVILANHMLYHVPDIPRAVKELARVLRPGGRLVASTNGTGHLRELMELRAELGFPPAPIRAFRRYGLENAPKILGKQFKNVRIVPYNNSLFVTEPQPLVDFLHSMVGTWALPTDKEEMLVQTIEQRIRGKGGFRIHTSAGVVLAW